MKFNLQISLSIDEHFNTVDAFTKSQTISSAKTTATLVTTDTDVYRGMCKANCFNKSNHSTFHSLIL